MARSRVSGTALLLAAAGAVLIVAGLRNAPVGDTLRAFLTGQRPPSGPSMLGPKPVLTGKAAGSGGTTGAGTGQATTSGKAAVDAARKYLGVPYLFGAHGPQPNGQMRFDCSGLVTWVLHHHLGIDLPSNTHTVTGVFYVWTGARTVPWSEQQPGDLVCWPGHIGIASGNGRMIHAPSSGDVVKESNIWRAPEPIIRRPKAYGG